MGNPYLIIAAVALLLPTLCAGQETDTSTSTQCENGTMTKDEVGCQILSLINSRRSQLSTGTQYNGFQNTLVDDKTVESLPPAKNMLKMTWSCDLEQQAKTQADEWATSCPAPGELDAQENVLFTDYDYGTSDMSDVLWSMLSQIDSLALTGVDTSKVTYAGDTAAQSEVPLKPYAILMRHDAKEVGCAYTTCSTEDPPILYLYCITDKGDAKSGDTIYEVGQSKACECEPPLVCDGGLCVEPVNTTVAPTLTTTATVTSGSGSPAVEATTVLSLAEFPGSSTAEPSTWCNYSEISDTMRMHMQDTHNFRRSTLALGQITDNTGATLPAATNMNYLQWNCTLEKEAHDFLKSCPTEGYQRPSDDLPAQNFYRAPIGSLPTWRDMNKKTVTEWWKPVRKVAGPGQSAYFRLTHSSTEIRSYTLMGWAASHQMGCSIARCGSDWVEACRYYPPGNKPDTQQYKPGKACSECNSLGEGACDATLGLCR